MTTWRVTTSTVTFVRLHEELLKYYRARVDQTADAEDMLSETWLAAGRLFEKRSSLRTYVYAIARRLVSQYWRSRARKLPLTDGADEHPTDMCQQDDWLIDCRNRHAIVRALENVPEIYRDALCLWLDGRNNFEIATRLGIEYHTARSRIARGKATLIAVLK
jgi:RNA polymerase sigma-70 factor (ECF subfamily)